MDTPLFSILFTTLRTLFYSEPWFEWMVPVTAALMTLYWLFVILNRTSLSKFWKFFLTILFLPITLVLFNIAGFYEYMNSGKPDKNCPEITINRLTKEIEPVKYDYLWIHVVPGPAETGFADFFVKQHEIFGKNLNVQNSHVCRLPYDERTRKLMQNLREAKEQQSKAAKKAGLPAERASEFGSIQFTLPGSAESRAKMDSLLGKDPKRKKGEEDRDESFGHAEFKAPEKTNVPKTERPVISP